MNYNAHHTLGKHTIFRYIFFHKGAMQYYNNENYYAIVDIRPFDYTVTCLY